MSAEANTGAREPDGAGSIAEHVELAGLVHAFIGMMQAGNIARLDVQHGDLRLSLRAHELNLAPVMMAGAQAVVAAPVPMTVQGLPSDDGHHVITAPMIGTFYTSSAPNEPPYVQVGDHVQEGQTIGIIEAMKIMNEIAADRAGTVVEIVALNAQTVEYGSPLVRIAPDDSA